MALDVTSLYDDIAHNGMRWGAKPFNLSSKAH
jgi:hypothetical protein